jgi:preprotein translocase subunit Sss1
MILAFKAAAVVIVVMAVIGFLGYLIDKNHDRQIFKTPKN